MTRWHSVEMTVGLKTPLRCGDRPFGFVARALPFVPGHVPLMAMVPCLVGRLQLPDQPESYKTVQGFLEANVRFTPFFILDPNDKEQPLFNLPEDKAVIEARFLRSKYGVAIDYGPRNAIDQRLFEIEAIQPFTRDGNGVRQTRLQGFMFWRAAEAGDLEMDETGAVNGVSLKNMIDASQWGGERNKGLGKILVIEEEPGDAVWDAPLSLDGDAPAATWPKGRKAPFYLKYPAGDDPDALANQVTGNLTPLTGRIFDPETGPGQRAVPPEIVWDIGWKSDNTVSLAIYPRVAVCVET